jgi:hypothetical protein
MSISPVLIPRTVVWVLMFGLLTVTRADPDLWGHVRFGLDILRDRALPEADGYSFTSDRPWINHEWLAEVLMGGAFAIGGAPALVLLKVTVLALAFGLIGWELRSRSLAPLAADLLLGIALFGSFFITSTVRPQIFSALCFTACLLALRRAEEGWRPALAVIPLVAAFWANVHGGWLVGIGVLGVWTGLRIVWPQGLTRGQWAAVGLSGLVATLATPYGWKLWQFLMQTVRFGRADISEWQPLYRSPAGAWLLWALPAALITAALWRTRRHRVTHVVVAVLLAAAAFQVVRLVPFLAIAAVVLMAPAFVEARPARAPQALTGRAAVLALGICLAGALAVTAEFVRRNGRCIDADEPWAADADAADYLRRTSLSGRLLVWFDWGEFAIWHYAPRLKVSMDGRRETVYSQQRLHALYGLYDAEPGWPSELAALAPDVAWLRSDLPLVAKLDDLGWHRVFASPQSIVFTRTVMTPPAAAPSIAATASPRCFPD